MRIVLNMETIVVVHEMIVNFSCVNSHYEKALTVCNAEAYLGHDNDIH